MRAEHPLEERLAAPNLWATLGTHVVASPASHAAMEVGGLTVHSFVVVNFYPRVLDPDAPAGWPI